MNTTHGNARKSGKTKTYRIWCAMKSRCTNKNTPAYVDYGARGIFVCKQWMGSFHKFLTDMGPCPDGYSIERKNNDLGYSPENCVWIPINQQGANRRNVKIITAQGMTMKIEQWAVHSGLKPQTMEPHKPRPGCS